MVRIEDADAETHVPQGDGQVGRDGGLAYPTLARGDGDYPGDAAVVVFNLGSGRGAAPPSLITTSTSAPGNASHKSDSAWFLIFTANGSRALAKRSTTVTLPSADAVCSMNPLETMSCPVSGWTTDASRRLDFFFHCRIQFLFGKNMKKRNGLKTESHGVR